MNTVATDLAGRRMRLVHHVLELDDGHRVGVSTVAITCACSIALRDWDSWSSQSTEFAVLPD